MLAGSGSKYTSPLRPKKGFSWVDWSSNDTLNGDEELRTSRTSELPSGPVDPGTSGLRRSMEVMSDSFKLRLASAVSSSTQNRMWSPSMVSGTVALVICTWMLSMGPSAT